MALLDVNMLVTFDRALGVPAQGLDVEVLGVL